MLYYFTQIRIRYQPYKQESLSGVDDFIVLSPLHYAGISGTTAAFIRTAAAFIVLIAFVRLGFEVFQFIQLIRTLDYVKDLVNWIEVILFVCSILFAFVFFTPCYCMLEWQWQVGVVAVFLAWIDLIFFLGKTPFTGRG